VKKRRVVRRKRPEAVSRKSAGNLTDLMHEKDKGNDVLAKQKRINQCTVEQRNNRARLSHAGQARTISDSES
jgi:hypothetical protein